MDRDVNEEETNRKANKIDFTNKHVCHFYLSAKIKLLGNSSMKKPLNLNFSNISIFPV